MDITKWWISLNDFWKTTLSIHIALHIGGVSYNKVLETADEHEDDIGKVYEKLFKKEFEQPSVLDFEKALSLHYIFLKPHRYLDAPDEEGNRMFLRKEIPDIRPLKHLSQLEVIDINYNMIIDDLSPVSDCKNLKILKCNSNKIETIQPIERLNNLIELDITNNKIKSLAPIQNKSWLRYLACGSNQIDNLKSIYNLTNLEYLNCTDDSSNSTIHIDDLNYLVNLKKLKELHLYNYRLHNELILANVTGNDPIEKLKSVLPNCEITY